MSSSCPDGRCAAGDSPSKRLSRIDLLAPIIASVVLVGLAMVVVSGVVRPLIYADEAGYLLNARAVAGFGELSGLKYFPGYSYLIAPAQWLAGGYPALARGTQVINIALLTISLALLWLLVRKLRLASSTRSALIALATCSFPSYLLFTSLSMSENALMPATLLCALALDAASREPRAMRWFVAGALPGVALTIHGRALVLVVALIAVVLVALVRRDIDLRLAAVTASGLGLGVLVTFGALAATSTLPWLDHLPGGDSGTTAFAERALGWSGITQVVATSFGHTFYLVAATFGFVVVGVWWLCTAAWRKKDPGGAVAWFTLVAMAGSMVLSAAHAAGSSGDGLVYGRYNEPFAALALAIGIAVAASGVRPRRQVALATTAIGASALLARLALDPGALGGRIDFVNVLGIVTAIRWLDGLRLGWIAALAIAICIALHLARLIDARLMVALTASAFLVSGASSIDRLWSDAAARAQQDDLAEIISEVPDELFGSERPCVALQPLKGNSWHTYNYQVVLPRHRFEPLPRADVDDSAWCGDVLLSATRSLGDPPADVRLVRSENHSDYSLWVRPGAVLDHLERTGRLYPAEWDGIVPPVAQRASLTAPTALSGEGPTIVEVEIRHTGEGSPWPNAASATPGALGPVRLGLRAGAELDIVRYDLPRSLAPGEATTVHVELTADDLRRIREVGGELRLEIVQEGVGWFGSDAATTLRIVE